MHTTEGFFNDARDARVIHVFSYAIITSNPPEDIEKKHADIINTSKLSIFLYAVEIRSFL